MKYGIRSQSIAILVCILSGHAWAAGAQSNAAARDLAHDVFKQLIEINTTDSIGSTTSAAQAMAKRLLDPGFPAADVVVVGPNDRKGNMIARYRGKTGSKLRLQNHRELIDAEFVLNPFLKALTSGANPRHTAGNP